MTKYTFPFATYGQNEILVPIDAAMVPIVSGALEKYLTRYVWQTDEDYEAGYNAIAKVMAAMSGNTLAELIRIQTATYRLLDNAINGTTYSETAGVVSPAVPDVPSGGETVPNAIRANVQRLWQLGENAATSQPFADPAINGMQALDAAGGWTARFNALQGVKDATWFGGGTPVTLSDLYTKQGIVSETDEGIINDAFEEVLGTVQDSTGIGQALATLFGSAVGVASDGGVMVALLGAALASATTAATTAIGLEATVAELRALNRRLTGSDAAGDPATPAELPTLAARVGTVATNTATTAARLYSDARRLSEAELSAEVSARVFSILGRVGDPVDGFTLNALAHRSSFLLSQVAPLAAGNDVYSTLIAVNDNVRRSADCCEENSGGGGFEPVPPYQPGLCGDATLALTSSGLDFAPNGIAAEIGFGTSASSLVTVLPSGGPGGVPVVQATDTGVILCFQLQKSPDDTGNYSLFVVAYQADGGTGPAGTVFDLSGPGPFTLPMFTEYEGEPVVYAFSANRRNSTTDELESFAGPQPSLYADVSQVS